MFVYLGQTRSRKLVARLAALGFGECTQRGEWPPRRHPWFLDNGAFSDWRSGRDFDGAAFLSDLISAVAGGELPDFIVCPDRVATGLESLEFSLRWRALCEFVLRARRAAGYKVPRLRWYFVVQDGITEDDVAAVLPMFDGLFVGGSLAWKLEAGGGMGGLRAFARAAVPHRPRWHRGSRALGAADRRRLDRLVHATVGRGEPATVPASARSRSAASRNALVIGGAA